MVAIHTSTSVTQVSSQIYPKNTMATFLQEAPAGAPLTHYYVLVETSLTLRIASPCPQPSVPLNGSLFQETTNGDFLVARQRFFRVVLYTETLPLFLPIACVFQRI